MGVGGWLGGGGGEDWAEGGGGAVRTCHLAPKRLHDLCLSVYIPAYSQPLVSLVPTSIIMCTPVFRSTARKSAAMTLCRASAADTELNDCC